MIYRVCFEIATRKILEMQTGGETPAHLQALIDNAVSRGWSADAVTCEFMNEEEYAQAKLNDPVLQAALADRTAKEATKRQALEDALTAWRDDLNAIEVKIETLSQPYRGIFKDILARIRKNTRVLSWMFENRDS